MSVTPDSVPPYERPPQTSWLDALDPMQSLRIRAAILFGVMPALFTIGFATLVERSMRNQIASEIGPNLTILASQVADKLDRALWERFNEIQVAATLQPMRAGTVDERRRLLTTLATASPNYTWLAYVDAKSSEVIAASRGLEEGINVDERNWFRAGRMAPSASVIHPPDDLGVDPPSSPAQRYIDISTPVWGPGNAPIGVIAARLDWAVAKEVQASVVPDTTRRARLNVTIYAQNGEALLDSGGTGWNDPLEAPTLPRDAAFRGSLWEVDDNGATYLTGYSRTGGYRDFRQIALLVSVRQRGSDLLAPAEELKDRIMATGFGLAGLSAIGGWITGWRISRRLVSITRSARRIQGGDILTEIPRFPGNDETSKLSNAVADLANDLRSRIPSEQASSFWGPGGNR